MSRDKNKFEKPELIDQFEAEANKWGAPLALEVRHLDVDRDYKMQVARFAQGREPLATVNHLLSVAGLPPITAEENEHCVTWTMSSKHIVNLDDDRLDNDKSRAFDFGIFKDGKYLTGNTEQEAAWYRTVAAIADHIPGLCSGRNFKDRKGRPRPDYPHVELKA